MSKKSDIYLRRTIDKTLLEWKQSPRRNPLLLRGARQVGKTASVRHLSRHFDNFVEINFEETPAVRSIFSDALSPEILIEDLSIFYNSEIVPGKTLLFFDEIQSCIPAIQSLRFFAEKMPELHVIAAGSLLEFALEEIPSYGVGRILSVFMYPMSFNEFLLATDEELLLRKKQESSPEKPLSDLLHQKLLRFIQQFLVLGGMPAVVLEYVLSGNFQKSLLQMDILINSYRDDFAKYKDKVPASRIREIFDAVVRQTGNKFVYSKAAVDANHRQIKKALNLLIMAGLVTPVIHSNANGLPLGAEINHKKQKMILFDTGIFLRILGLDISKVLLNKDFSTINKGVLAEQFVGLELLKYSSPFQRGQLYYWHREAKSSNAEVDYLTVIDGQITPIEVKAGKKGRMQSLYLFLEEKHIDWGIRISNENFCSYERIRVFPLYAVENIQQK